METLVETVAAGWTRTFAVPPSKSVHQRALVLAALADGPLDVRPAPGSRPPGEDVRRCAAAVDALGRWHAGALGSGRERLVLDLGESGTALRFATALATLRPAGARTLLRGRPVLLRRPHAPLVRALGRLGGHVRRRRSGALRVLGGGLGGGRRLTLDVQRSSQFASALMLVAPRIGGLTLDLRGGQTSRAYLELTATMLRATGVPVTLEPDRVEVAAGAPQAGSLSVPADASAAAGWFTAATLTGGRARVAGLPADDRQADLAILPLLAAFGARVEREADAVVVAGPPRLGAPPAEPIDLRAAPDLLFLVGVLAARASGTTTLAGITHARGKESDRIEALVAGLAAVGVRADVDASDRVTIHGGAPRGGTVDVRGDHRVAFAFGALGLAVPGVVLAGAGAAAKSQPGFLADLAALAREHSET